MEKVLLWLSLIRQWGIFWFKNVRPKLFMQFAARLDVIGVRQNFLCYACGPQFPMQYCFQQRSLYWQFHAGSFLAYCIY